MPVTDPIADMLTRIRNAVIVNHDNVLIPASRMGLSITKILKNEGFIDGYEVLKSKPRSMIKIRLKYIDNQPVLLGLERVSKPGLRVYVKRREIPRVYGGLGIAVLSTPRGVMIGDNSGLPFIGKDLLCYVW